VSRVNGIASVHLHICINAISAWS